MTAMVEVWLAFELFGSPFVRPDTITYAIRHLGTMSYRPVRVLVRVTVMVIVTVW